MHRHLGCYRISVRIVTARIGGKCLPVGTLERQKSSGEKGQWAQNLGCPCGWRCRQTRLNSSMAWRVVPPRRRCRTRSRCKTSRGSWCFAHFTARSHVRAHRLLCHTQAYTKEVLSMNETRNFGRMSAAIVDPISVHRCVQAWPMKPETCDAQHVT
jgi:hypothetical protein